MTLNAIVVSAMESAAAAERYGLARDKIILSAKVSGVQDLITVYRDLAAKCDYALHLGLDRGGHGRQRNRRIDRRAIRAAAGRHRRYDPRFAHSRAEWRSHRRSDRLPADSAVAGAAAFTPQVAACPGCGRTTSTFFQEMADQIQTYLREADAGLARAAIPASKR